MQTERRIFMKNIFIKLILLSCFVVILASYSTAVSTKINNNDSVPSLDPLDIQKIDKSETYPGSRGALVKIYKDISSIINDADVIIFGEVVKARNIEYIEFPMTISSLTVTRSLKGNIPQGAIVNVAEMGGEITGKGKFVLDVPVMTVGNTYCLFLLIDNELYRIVGAFQGKFINRSGYLFQQATIDVKLKNYEPLSESIFIDAVNKILNK